MEAVWLVAARDLKQRWRRITVVMLVAGLAGALTLATAAGARRTSTSLDRFKTSSRSADVEISTDATPDQLNRLRQVKGVAAVGTLLAYGVVLQRAPDFQSIGTPADGDIGVTVDRDRIVAGRAPDPNAVDEITLGEGFANRLHLHAGDVLDAVSFTPPQVAAIEHGLNNTTPEGPRVRLRVVGIVRRPLDLGEQAASGGVMVLTPAFAREFNGRIGVFGSRVRVRTVHGLSDVPSVLREARTIFGDGLFETQTLALTTQGASNAIDLLSFALWIAAAVAAIGALIVMGLLIGRETRAAAADQQSLRELGATRRERIAMILPSTTIAAFGAACVALIGAIALSPAFPLGVARRADPNVGLHVDWSVLALGWLAIVVTMFLIVGFVGWRVTRRAPHLADAHVRRSTIAERAAAAGGSPALTNGLRLAFDPDRGRATSVRSAFVGAIVGVIAVTGALAFGASLDHLAGTRSLYGSAWDFQTQDITTNSPCGARGTYGLLDSRDVGSLTEICSQSVEIDGRPTNALAYRELRGDSIQPEIINGRAPSRDNEIALGAKTLAALHVHIGSSVTVKGVSHSRDYEIVGRAVFPTLGQAQPLADGAAFTGSGYAPIFDQNLFSRFFVGRFAPGAHPAALRRYVSTRAELAPLTGPSIPVEVARLQQINWLPVALVALLGACALVAVAQAIVIGVRRRQHELALLKALGFTRQQVRATVAYQATTIGIIGAAIGIPLGCVAGAAAWHAVANGLGVTTVIAWPTVALIVTLPAALLLVNVVAYLPARAAACARPAQALRTL